MFKNSPFMPFNSQERPRIDQYGNLPEVILDEVPHTLRSAGVQDSSRVVMETRVV